MQESGLSTLWVLGVKLGSSHLEAASFPYQTISLTLHFSIEVQSLEMWLSSQFKNSCLVCTLFWAEKKNKKMLLLISIANVFPLPWWCIFSLILILALFLLFQLHMLVFCCSSPSNTQRTSWVSSCIA